MTSATPIAEGTLITTPFTLADGSVITLLARKRAKGLELTDWGTTADYLHRCNRKWDEVVERMALRHVAHGRVTIEDREIVTRIGTRDPQRYLGALVQTILTLNNLVLLAQDPESDAFDKKVDTIVRARFGSTHNITPRWYEPEFDPYKAFTVDYRVNGASPAVHIYVVGAASKITRVAATSLFYRSKNLKVPSVVIMNQDIGAGQRQRERLQVAGERIIWNIDKQTDKLAEFIKNPPSPN